MEQNRHRRIIIASVIGIIANLFLVIFKVIVGLLSNSIAIIIDAVNNFSDMLSSVVTIIGAAFSRLSPDREHPMGHGRSEYLSASIIAMIILYIGITAAIESVNRIIHPETPNYTTFTILVVCVAIVVKVILGIYVQKVGRKEKSSSLQGSGFDALCDALISFATLIAAIVFMCAGISIEAYLALFISLFISYNGIKMLRNTFSVILGERANSSLSRKVRSEVQETAGVEGAYDLIIHDYGPHQTYASINIEVPESMTAQQIDIISREIRRRVYRKCHVVISSVGIYSINTNNRKVARLRHQVNETISNFDRVLQMHGFHVDDNAKIISFDLVVDFNVKNRHSYFHQIRSALEKALPEYTFEIAFDSDFSD